MNLGYFLAFGEPLENMEPKLNTASYILLAQIQILYSSSLIIIIIWLLYIIIMGENIFLFFISYFRPFGTVWRGIIFG